MNIEQACAEEGVTIGYPREGRLFDEAGRVRSDDYGDIWITPSKKVMSRTELGQVFLLIFYEEN